ncbi:MAG TPA: 4Fe-4S dicluster domain-containing protein [Steroidobacteraceae bacterium]|nr:4Fe-4S dicluster domain-containing protein [Steroidobacteraceae bacterium]
MTMLPKAAPGARKLGLVIDLDTCVGCHACAVSCKEWNGGGEAGMLPDYDKYGTHPDGVWFNRVHSYETESQGCSRTVNLPRSCLHCEDALCVTVCPTGASYKRAEDGIVLVDPDICIGCKLCSWACPYGARELDEDAGVMRKCTLCVDRIYDQSLPEVEREPACVASCPTRARHFGDLADPQSHVSRLVAERGGVDLLADLGYRPTNRYLPPRRATIPVPPAETREPRAGGIGAALLNLLDKALSR